MGAVSALSDAGAALRRNPVLFAAAAAVGVPAAVAGGAVGVTDGPVPFPGLWVAALYLVVEPFLAAGFLGLADEAVAGRTRLGVFLTHGAEHYLDMLAARVVVAVIVVATVALGGVAAVGTGLELAAQPTGGPTMHDPLAGAAELLAGSLLVAAVLGPVVVVGHVVLQFYPAGVVLGDAGAAGSFAYSYRLVRENPLAAVGYTLVAFVAGTALLAATGVLVGLAVSGPLTAVPAGGAADLVAVAVVGGGARAVGVGLVRTYYVAFVRSVAG